MIELRNITRSEIMVSLVGGFILAVATTIFFLLFGTHLQIISSLRTILNLQFDSSGFKKLTVIAGLIFSSALVRSLDHQHIIKFWPFDSNSYIAENPALILIISGFLVGKGSVLGNGGFLTHVIQGLPLFRWKSYLAVILLLGAAYYTNQINLRKVILETIQFSPTLKLPSNIDGENYLLPCLIIPFIGFLLSKGKSVRDLVEFICTFFLGSLVGLAVMIGGLVSQKRVLDFFNFTNPIYNPRIVIFLLTAVVINLIFFSIIKKSKVPLLCDHFEVDESRFSIANVTGPLMHGVGWGLTGITIETMLTFIAVRPLNIILYWGISCLVGVKAGLFLLWVGQKLVKKKK